MDQFIGKGTVSLFGFLGAIVLLLWGVRMIRKGIESWLLPFANASSPIFNNRVYAVVSGMFGAALLQSSTALVLIVSSVATKISIPLSVALAFVLGADVGTSIAALLFSFDIKSLGPLLLFLGFFIQRTAKSDINRNRFGQVLMGFGFVLYGLSSIGAISIQMRDSQIISTIFVSAFINDVALAILVACLLTWLSHSSLAIVLLIIELVASQIISVDLGLSLVIGANIGACLPAYTDSLGLPVEARRLTFGNVIFRLTGGLLVLPFLPLITNLFSMLQFSPEKLIIIFHILFNVSVALIFIFFTKPIGAFILKILPDPEKLSYKKVNTKFLRLEDIENPNAAITNLMKEVNRIGDNVYVMIDHAYDGIDDYENIKIIHQLEEEIDGLYKSVSKYLQRLYTFELTKEQSTICMKISSYCTELEQAADIISNNFLEALLEKHNKHISISSEYKNSLETIFTMLRENVNRAQELFRNPKTEEAHLLQQKKNEYKQKVIHFAMKHKQELLKTNPDSIAINAIYLDMINDLRRVNAHITSIAHFVIDN